VIAPGVEDIHRLRIIGLTLAPACAGLLLWIAIALWRRPPGPGGRDESRETPAKS
jgi:hypothetical protein